MTEQKIPSYRADMLGAPFQVVLLESVTAAPDGAVTIPDVEGMTAGVGMARLWRDERLSGEELRFLRRAAGISKEKLAASIGGATGDIEAYETGPRPMTVGLEKYIRLHLFNALRRKDPTSPRVDEMINYLEWALEEWKPAFRDAAVATEVEMKYHPTGWQEVRTRT